MSSHHFSREAAQLRERAAAGGLKYCAYNGTRERFLCADVEAGEFAAAALETRLAALTPGRNTALWMVPFRGISPTSVRLPIDLVYLDENCSVLETVESFPILGGPQGGAPAASVLAMPANAIAAAEIRAGDRLILCTAAEMKERVQQLIAAKAAGGAETEAGPADPGARGGAGRVLRWVERSKSNAGPNAGPMPAEVAETEAAMAAAVAGASAPMTPGPIAELLAAAVPAGLLPPVVEAVPADRQQPAVEDPIAAEPVVPEPVAAPQGAPKKAKKGWLASLLSPDPPEPRKAQRESLPGLVAFFFTGGDPVPHGVRDISATGFYVFTEERWYPGTILRITLTDQRHAGGAISVMLYASVIRSGNDGVGLQFVFQDDARRGNAPMVQGMMGGASKAQVEQFLRELKAAGPK